MVKINTLSRPLLLTILVPVVAGVLLTFLVHLAFEAAHDVAVETQKQDIQEFVELAASSIERLWILPRERTVIALSESPSLRSYLDGEAPFDEVRNEWITAMRLLWA